MTERRIVLVAAPDAGLRRSIEFALASGRFKTDAHGYATSAFASSYANQAVCAVLDDEAIEDWRKAPAQFVDFARPIILLVSPFRLAPDAPLLTVLRKPFLGEPLISAVRDAVAATSDRDT